MPTVNRQPIPINDQRIYLLPPNPPPPNPPPTAKTATAAPAASAAPARPPPKPPPPLIHRSRHPLPSLLKLALPRVRSCAALEISGEGAPATSLDAAECGSRFWCRCWVTSSHFLIFIPPIHRYFYIHFHPWHAYISPLAALATPPLPLGPLLATALPPFVFRAPATVCP